MKHAKAESKRKKNKQLRVGRFLLQHTNINPIHMQLFATRIKIDRLD